MYFAINDNHKYENLITSFTNTEYKKKQNLPVKPVS